MLAGLVALALARAVSRPVARVSEASRALAAGELEPRAEFFRHNRSLVAELRELLRDSTVA